ncbi:hypothetical protein AB0G29_23480 [Streptomyces parvus]|uniref:hypothetical protein n=1 Tax=Streptomyces parvus TaxID=66428 RepID=UPI0033FC5495
MFGRRRVARQQRGAWKWAEAVGATHAEPPLNSPVVVRQEVEGLMMPHPNPLVVDGDVRACGMCGSYRGWVVISLRDEVWLRCPAGHEQHEPGLDTAWYDRHSGPVTQRHETYDDGLRDLGH